MANFGFTRLTVVAAYEPHWREARSAIGAPKLLQNAKETESLAEAVADCTLVIGTGTLTYRKPEQPVVSLPSLAPIVAQRTRSRRPHCARLWPGKAWPHPRRPLLVPYARRDPHRSSTAFHESRAGRGCVSLRARYSRLHPGPNPLSNSPEVKRLPARIPQLQTRNPASPPLISTSSQAWSTTSWLPQITHRAPCRKPIVTAFASCCAGSG